MVSTKKALFIALLAFAILFAVPWVASAQETYRWQVHSQNVILDVDSSGSVYMTYNVDATIQKGVWNEVWIPATVGNMKVTSVTDGSGTSHNFYIDGGQIKTRDYDPALKPGDHITLIIKSTLPGFVYQSDTPGYDIVQFTPPWWDMTIPDSQVKFVLPAEINTSEVFTGSRQYSGIGTENGRTIVYFNRTMLNNNEQFDTAVSFPDSYMAPGAVTSKGVPSGGISGPVDFGGIMDSVCNIAFCGLFLLVPIFIVLSILFGRRRGTYSSPVLSMNGMGVNQNLDPVEAAMLLRDDPRRILTMIMFGLMKKGNVKLLSTEPLRLQLVARKDLNYYEALFSDAIKGDTLNEDGLLTCFKALAQRVVDKTRPYSRKETEAFYRKKIDDAWKDVQALDTPELKLQKYDTNMFWLMADEQFASKTPDALRSPGWNTATVPPYYWWYPYYFGFPHGTTGPSTGQPTTPGTGQPTNQTTSSVESFAKNFTSSVEKTSTGVVAGVESFLGVRNAANAPPAAAAPSRSSSGGSACVSCACACVSCACACACAGGGGGCT
jgi:hypothetical protein